MAFQRVVDADLSDGDGEILSQNRLVACAYQRCSISQSLTNTNQTALMIQNTVIGVVPVRVASEPASVGPGGRQRVGIGPGSTMDRP
jgi:hypothetical protein